MQKAKILNVQTIPKSDVPDALRGELREDAITAMELRIKTNTGRGLCYTDWPRADIETPLQPTLDAHDIPHGSLEDLVGATILVESDDRYYLVRTNEDEA